MRRQARVVWSKGLFLTPQLFEAQERFLEGEVQFRSALAGFEQWGVCELEIDETALINDKLRLTRCAGIMDDGLAFSMPGTDALPPQREFGFAFPTGQNTLDVFLAVPERRDGQPNIGYPGGPLLRFTAEDATIYDNVDGQDEVIQVARPNFQIVFGGEATAGMDLLQIARIRRGTEAIYELDRRYTPPCLNAVCNLYLWDTLLNDLLERLVFVSDRLNKERGQQSELLADFKDSDIRRFWVLHIVNRALPELKHIHSIRHCHPEELYRFLLRLGGALCTFTEQYRATDFPAYDHRNLDLCLLPVAVQVEHMLRIVAYRNKRCVSLSLDVVEAGRHLKTQLASQEIESGALYLGVRKDPGVGIADLEGSLKIVGRSTVEGAVALAGLQLSHEIRTPADCVQRADYVFFRIVRPTPAVRTPPVPPRGVSGRPLSREEADRTVSDRRLEVWQDIRVNEEIHIVTLNPALISMLDLLLVRPEAQGYSSL